jgi:hypothetical protein
MGPVGTRWQWHSNACTYDSAYLSANNSTNHHCRANHKTNNGTNTSRWKLWQRME